MIHPFVFGHDSVSLPVERVVFGLLRSYAFVFEEVGIGTCELFEESRLFVISLQDTILVRAEFLELCFEELIFLVCDCLFVENEHVGDVVGVDLDGVSFAESSSFRTES